MDPVKRKGSFSHRSQVKNNEEINQASKVVLGEQEQKCQDPHRGKISLILAASRRRKIN